MMPGQFSPEVIFGFFLVFARLGTMVMLLPALGETTIPARIRLSLALLISLITFPLVEARLPVLPEAFPDMVILLIGEIIIGLIVGACARIFMAALHVAGVAIAYHTGLGAAQVFDPVQGSQGAIVGTFLMLLGVTLIFVTGLHGVMIGAMHDSYDILPAGMMPESADFAMLAARTVSQAFRIGIEMAAPFLVYALVFNIGLGIVARLIPQLQVFFIAMPLNIVLGFAILFVTIGSSMAWFLGHFEAFITDFLR